MFFIYREKIYYEELAHVIVGDGQLEIRNVGQQAGDPKSQWYRWNSFSGLRMIGWGPAHYEEQSALPKGHWFKC